MVFSSITFLFFFLPLVLVVFYSVRDGIRFPILLLFSLFFYFYGENYLILVMLSSTMLDYVAGIMISESRKRANSPIISKFEELIFNQKLWVVISICFNLIFLVFFKYYYFLTNSVDLFIDQFGFSQLRLDLLINVSLPLGISFYTFQSMSYTIDVYHNKIDATRNIIVFMTYVTMFPQLVAGPIVRFAEIESQLRQHSVSFKMFSEGLQRFLIGFIKKVLIANPLGEIADRIFAIDPGLHSTHIAWLGLVVYSFQIYFDFSGYSCMAIGLGRMFGFNFPENFNYPYLSRSLTEFWRRWHMTLSNWFRDYLYIPLGGSKVSGIITAKNLLIVFVLCGLWHGAKWNFIVWGLYHGLFLGLERVGLKKLLEKYPAIFGHTYFITVLLVSWVFFRITDISESILFLKTLVVPKFSGVIALSELFDMHTAIILVFALVFSMPVVRILIVRKNELSGFQSAIVEFLFMSALVALTFLSILFLVAATYNPFIYFRF